MRTTRERNHDRVGCFCGESLWWTGERTNLPANTAATIVFVADATPVILPSQLLLILQQPVNGLLTLDCSLDRLIRAHTTLPEWNIAGQDVNERLWKHIRTEKAVAQEKKNKKAPMQGVAATDAAWSSPMELNDAGGSGPSLTSVAPP